jgi:alkylation response protein AidB-like acyl-CoA dehydrogenase
MKRILLPFLTETQNDLRGVVHDLLAAQVPDHGADGPDPAATWSALTGIGVGGMLVPERLGGLGLGAVEFCLLGIELGWQAVPQPVLDTVAAGDLLAHSGRTEPLAALVDGRLRCTVAAPAVPFAVDADAVEAVLAVDGGVAFLVPSGECRLTRLRSMDDNRRIFRVEHDRRAADVVTADDAALTRLDDLVALGTAALLTGLGARMFSDARDYACVREQFGRPIGSFQAVAHKLAADYVLVERAVVTTLRAAQEFDRGSGVAVSIACQVAGDAARRLSIDVLQTFGGIGFTAEHSLGRRLKLAKALEAAGGTGCAHRDRIADAWFDDSPLLPGGTGPIGGKVAG